MPPEQHDGVRSRDIFAFPMEVRALQSSSTLQGFYSRAKPIVETSIKEALNIGPPFRRINDHFRPLIPVVLFDMLYLAADHTFLLPASITNPQSFLPFSVLSEMCGCRCLPRHRSAPDG
jgi:hypothetical protein